MNKNKYRYYCRHCGKMYLTQWQADLCFELDMEELYRDKNREEKTKKTK